jgi:hypothetical protein
MAAGLFAAIRCRAHTVRVLFVLALILVGCERPPVGYTSISDLVLRPANYEGKTVKVRGQVTDVVQLPLPSVRYYHLREGDAEILVWATEHLPATGEQVSVVGTVSSMGIVDSAGVGLHLTEQRRW